MSTPLFLLSWLNLSLSLEGAWWAFGLLLLAGAGLSYVMYKRTIPPSGRTLRGILFVLRLLAVSLLIALLFHPVLTVKRPYLEKPDIALLIDRSRSLQIRDSGTPRSQVVRQLLADPVWKKLTKRFDLHVYPFSVKIDTALSGRIPENLSFDGEGTDISASLKEARKLLLDRYFAGAVLISDGNYNTGENPEFFARKYGTPVFTIGVGNPNEKKDIVLQRAVTNEVAYTKNRVPVEVFLTHRGFSGKRIQVLLKQGREVVDQKNLLLSSDGQIQRVKLFFIPQKAGFLRYRVEIPPLQGEFTAKNNFRNFVVRVLESKIKVLLLGGEPSFDFKFIRRGLQTDKNIELTPLVQRKGGRYYFAQNLRALRKKDFQLFITVGFPRWPLSGQLRAYLQENLLKRKKPLFFIEGPNLHLPSLRLFQSVLPFELGTVPRTLHEVSVTPTMNGENSPVTLLSDSRSENQQRWNNLPPVFTYLQNFRPVPGSSVLLEVAPALSHLPDAPQYRKPLLLSRQVGVQRSLAFLGYGIWRWDLMMWGVGKTNETFLQFLHRAVRWLISREKTKHVRITTDKLVYRSGEEVYLQGQVYDEAFRPVDDASVEVKLRHGKQVQTFVLEPVGEGHYEAHFRVFRGGDYFYTGKATRGDQFFGADTGRFSAGEFEIEFQTTRMNEPLLKRLAQMTGGAYLRPDEISRLPQLLQAKSRKKVRISELNLWNEWLALAVLVLLLAVEWTLRRRRGML